MFLIIFRKIKSEKLLEILRQQQYQPSTENIHSTLVAGNIQPSRASQLPGFPNSGMGRLSSYPNIHPQSHIHQSYFR